MNFDRCLDHGLTPSFCGLYSSYVRVRPKPSAPPGAIRRSRGSRFPGISDADTNFYNECFRHGLQDEQGDLRGRGGERPFSDCESARSAAKLGEGGSETNPNEIVADRAFRISAFQTHNPIVNRPVEPLRGDGCALGL